MLLNVAHCVHQYHTFQAHTSSDSMWLGLQVQVVECQCQYPLVFCQTPTLLLLLFVIELYRL